MLSPARRRAAEPYPPAAGCGTPHPVKPWETIEKALAPDGTEMVLARRDGEWVVRYGGKVLMSSRQHGSEDALAELALRKAAHRRTVLVGGLGLGFTVRAALDRIPVDAKVVVAELTPALLDWNRRLVGKLAGRPLDDPRTHVHIGDCVQRIQEAKSAYDAILLDIDNGPGSMVHETNHRLYGHKGIAACRDALRQGGVLAVWSAHHDLPYLERLKKAGLEAETRIVPARGAEGGLKHVIFLGVKRIGGPGGRRGPATGPVRATKPAARPSTAPKGRGGAGTSRAGGFRRRSVTK
jgi:spermidine synthase